MIVAGAGAGGGAAHQAVPAGNGGNGGFSGIGAGIAAVGTAGSAGSQASATVGGGSAALAAAPGIGGILTPDTAPTSNGFPGVAGAGGAGGTDIGFDSGGGGGGGYFGGGGGAATGIDNSTGGGGGGGSSYVAVTGTSLPAAAPTAITGAAGTATAGGAVAGANGSLAIDWVPCLYALSVTKTASPSSLNAGSKTVWTVTVTNSGPDAMTRGDTVTLSDTLPVGPNGGVTPQFKVLSVSSSGGTSTSMSSGALSCAGVTVGAAMPASTVCSRPYAAPSAPGAPSGGTRGLNSGETLTITYEQVISNTASCGSISNTASTVDRATSSGTTDIIGVTASRSITTPLTINCYDLAVVKTVNPTAAAVGHTLIWTVKVTNNGPAPMVGTDDPFANPLIVTDAAPTANVSAPAAFSSSGAAGSCTYSSGTITCPSGLPVGQTQTFTFNQTINAGTPNGTVIANTASVSDPKSGDSNDTSTASVTVQSVALLTLTKVSNGGVGTFTFTGNNGWASQNITTATSGVGVTGGTQPVNSTATPTVITETLAPGYFVTAITCSGLPSGGTYALDLNARSVTFNTTATAAGGTIACTFTNGFASLTITKSQVGGPNPITAAGQSISYAVNVANTGGTPLAAVTLTDALAQGATALTLTSAPTLASGDTNANSVLDIGETWVYAAAYAVPQSVIDSGATLSNTASVGTDKTAPLASAAVTTPIAQTRTMAINKSATLNGSPVGLPVTTALAVGDVITYRYDVTNSGNVTLSAVSISDVHNGNNSVPIPGSEAVLTDVAPANDSTDATAANGLWSSLAPGDTVRFTASYSVNQTDVDLIQ